MSVDLFQYLHRMHWWLWVVFGLVLLFLEVVITSGLFALFPGVAAILVGLSVMAYPSFTPWLQWVSFTVLSFLLILSFRRKLLRRFPEKESVEMGSMVGQTALATSPMDPGARGTVEFQGTVWSAKNVGTIPIGTGTRCKIERVEGLLLEVTLEK